MERGNVGLAWGLLLILLASAIAPQAGAAVDELETYERFASKSSGAAPPASAEAVEDAPDGASARLADKPGNDLLWAFGFDGGDLTPERVMLVVRLHASAPFERDRLELSYHLEEGRGSTSLIWSPANVEDEDVVVDLTQDRAWTREDLQELRVRLAYRKATGTQGDGHEALVDAMWVRVDVRHRLAAAFQASHDSAAIGENIRFQDTSLNTSAIVSREWRVDDRLVGENATLEHAFDAKGERRISLRVTDSRGSTDVAEGVFLVKNLPPSADFVVEYTDDNSLRAVRFSDESADLDGGIVRWTWDFGDGSRFVCDATHCSTQDASGAETTGNATNLQHTFAGTGPYAVRLSVEDAEGATAVSEKSVRVPNLPPRARFDFTPETPSRLDVVSFQDSSVDDDGRVVGWSWDFGDGSTSDEAAPDHRFASLGAHTVRLTVTDDRGGQATIERSVLVRNLAPVASFAHAPGPVGEGLRITFTEASNDLDGRVVAWSWDFGDGSNLSCDVAGCTASGEADGSSQNAPTHLYARGGWYTVRLEVLDDDGASAVHEQRIQVCPIVCLHVVMSKPMYLPSERVEAIVTTSVPFVDVHLMVQWDAQISGVDLNAAWDLALFQRELHVQTDATGSATATVPPELLVHMPAPGRVAALSLEDRVSARVVDDAGKVSAHTTYRVLSPG